MPAQAEPVLKVFGRLDDGLEAKMPAIQFSGLASGLDTDAIVDAMLQVERIPNVRREQENRILESKSQILDNLTSALSDLSSKAKALESTKDILSFNGTSSDEKTAKLAVSGDASRGSYELQVTQLASAQRNYSNVYDSPDDTTFKGGGKRTLTISIGGEDTKVEIRAQDSLAQVAEKINSSGAGVSAGIFKGADGYRLQIVGNKTGEANAITYSGDIANKLGLDANLVTEAKDAKALLDGFEISSESNTFEEVMNGVTLQVFRVQQEGEAPLRIDVSPNEGDVKGKVQALMDSFNAVVDILQAQKGEGKGRETLSGDSTVRMIESRLRQVIANSSDKLTGTNGERLTLAGLFKSNQFTGKLSFDDNGNFDKLLDSNFEGAARYFTGHQDPDDPTKKVEGLAGRIMDMVEELTGIPKISVEASAPGEEGEDESSSSSSASKSSLIGARKAGLQSRIDSNNDRITAHERYLESYENQLRMQYAALEEMMSQMNAQGNFLNSV